MTGERENAPLTDLQKLAIAVLQGQEDSAYPFLDEALARLNTPEDFESREDLIKDRKMYRRWCFDLASTLDERVPDGS